MLKIFVYKENGRGVGGKISKDGREEEKSRRRRRGRRKDKGDGEWKRYIAWGEVKIFKMSAN